MMFVKINSAITKPLKTMSSNLLIFLKWVAVGLVCGLVIGFVGSLFYYALSFVTNFRMEHKWMLYLLPVAGLIIVFLHKIGKDKQTLSTDLVIASIRSDGQQLPPRMAPLIFISTALTHLCGGSAGREGAALQLGGSIGNMLGRALRLDDKSKNIVVMCGMSAAFSALFGTPIAAAIFSMELVSVGIMYFSALVPCVISSIVASAIAGSLSIKPEVFTILEVPEQSLFLFAKIIILAAICAGVSIIFCSSLKLSANLYHKLIKNEYLRIVVGGLLVIGLVFLFGTRDYLGSGMHIIEQSIEGVVRPEAFLLKIIFTAITLGAGYKGGEIVPTFFIGSTLGCFVGGLLGISPSLGAAIGLIAMFCSVTNCPITALLIGFEMFSFTTPVFFLVAVAVSYMLSGYYGLYKSQKIIYSKLKPQYINQDTQ